MAWTGLVGVGLAKRLFLPEGSRPSLLVVILPSILLHGLFDYSLSSMSAASNSRNTFGVYVFLTSFFVVFIGSYVLIGRATGCRQGRGTCYCCCAPNFWEDQYMGMGAEARQSV